jgi:arabinose-5-phosphate isomerase
MNFTDIIVSGKKTLKTEAETLFNQIELIDETFAAAVEIIQNSGGKLIVTGMGKSGIIGKKMAATFASTGTPSFFMHPGEAYHGDLGMVESKDVILALSFSGETDEVLKIIPFFKNNSNAIISITGNNNSTLAKNSIIHLTLNEVKEACPLRLAPTSSTTVTMAMGDSLAVALMELRNFKSEEFAKFHPGGSLGRKLLAKVENIMHSQDLPVVSTEGSFSEIIQTMSKARLGIALVNDTNNISIGIITDGDLRRIMEANGKNAWDNKANEIMTQNPKKITIGTSLQDAENLLIKHKVASLIVTNHEDVTLGVVQIYDL